MKKSSMKKMLAGLSAVCMAASALPVTGAAVQAADSSSKIYGDANCNSTVEMADAVLILQSLSNSDKFGTSGSDANHISATGEDLGDVYERGSGLTAMDALSIQKYLLKLCDLPESYQAGYTEDPVTETIYIHLYNTSISVEGDNSGYTSVSGTKVTISHSGTYYVDGTLDDGQIIVNIPDETADAETVKIFLNGVNITGKSDSAILVSNAENTSINLVDGTENYISDGDTAYTSGAAVIEAKDDLTIKGGDAGTGKLIVTANTQDGIVCNNDIKINNAIVDVTTLNETSGSKTNGINGKSSVTIKGTSAVTVDATSDGIKSGSGSVAIESGTVTVKAGADALQSGTTIDISGGNVTVGGDRGITPGTALNITGGTVVATATDNQVDSSLMSGTTQSTWLFNCIAESTDTTWKKANSFQIGSLTTAFEKKYQYVLVSDASLTGTKTITNTSTGATVTHTNGTMETFTASGTVTTFNTVNPAGKDGSSVVITDPVTDGYTITLSGASIQTNAPSDVASISNGVLTITKEGVFTVTGTGSGTQIVVNVDKTAYPNAVVELDLAGMSLTNTSTSPIYVASIGDEVQIVAKNGTENTITDGSNYTNADSDQGAIYSKDDIKFKGKGTLTVNGNAADAIVGKDDVKIYNGTLIVNAVDDGIRGKDSVRIGDSDDLGTEGAYDNLSVTVKTNNGSTGGDGIKATNDTDTGKGYVEINGGTVNINSYSDGIQAEQEFTMNGGDVTIYTYSGSSYTGSGSSSSDPGSGFNPGGGWGGGQGGMGQDGNANKTDISAKGIKVSGLWSYDTNSVPNATYLGGGNLTVNAGTVNIDSSDDALHCGAILSLNGGEFTLNSADDGIHADQIINIGKSGGSFTDVQIYIGKCYEGVESIQINQNCGTVYIISGDDGYNAGNNKASQIFGVREETTPDCRYVASSLLVSGFSLNINGGLVVANSASGDHDSLDSNANIYLNGGYVCANGQEPLDCGDNNNSISYNGGSVITMTAGNTSLTTRYSFLDSSNNVICSFLSGSGGGTSSLNNCTVQSGGTVSGGTSILSQAGSYAVTIGGTLSGGSSVGQGSSTQPGGPGQW